MLRFFKAENRIEIPVKQKIRIMYDFMNINNENFYFNFRIDHFVDESIY